VSLCLNVFCIVQIKQESREEVLAITRERVKVQQELDSVKNLQARQLKEHEQVYEEVLVAQRLWLMHDGHDLLVILMVVIWWWWG
jgi:hypothetical protein